MPRRRCRSEKPFDVALADAYAAAAGGSSALKAGFDAKPAKARVEGTALFASLAEFTGDLTASSGSLFDLMRWMGADTQPSGDPFKASVNGKIKATTRDIAFTETDVLVNASANRFEGRLDFSGARPKLEGNIASDRIDLVRLFGANKRMTLVIAIAYGGRWDIAAAAQALARRCVAGEQQVDAIDEGALAQHLSLSGLPDPDLFIRTGGEQRISNFLLWNLAYTELYFCDTLWPDFGDAELAAAFDYFAGRQRRFGRVPGQVEEAR